MTTGALFGLLTVVHVWRMVSEPYLATHAGYLLITAASLGLGLWAWRLVSNAPRP